MKWNYLIAFAGLLVMLIAAPLRAQEAVPKDLIKTKLLADVASIQPGKPFQVGVLLDISPKWHVYWINFGEAGIPTTVEWQLPEGFKASSTLYPVPTRLTAQGSITVYGYENQVMLMTTITPPARIDATRVDIGAKASWLACEDLCIPGEAKVSLSLPVGNTSSPANAETFAKWSKRLPTPVAKSPGIVGHSQEVSIQSSGPGPAKGQLTLTIDWKDAPPASIEWFPPAGEGVLFGTKVAVETIDRRTTVKGTFEITSPKVASPLESVLAFKMGAERVGAAVPIVVEPSGR